MDRHFQVFLEEARELLVELENTLIELEDNSEDNDLLDRAFRAMHTIKGSSGMFGREDVSMFTHDIESVYDFIRNGDLYINKEIINLTLSAKDQIELMLFGEASGKDINEDESERIITEFKRILGEVSSVEEDKNTSEEKDEVKAGTDKLVTYLIDLKPEEEIFMTGTDPALLIEELNTLGKCVVIGNFENLPDLKEIEPDKNYTNWKILISTNKAADDIKDVFIFVEDSCELSIDKVKDSDLPEDEEIINNICESIKGNFNADLRTIKKIIEEKTTSIEKIKTVKQKQPSTPSSSKEAAGSSIRVSSDKLDELVNLVGELVIVQAGLNQMADKNHDAELTALAEQIERLTGELRDSTLNIRMLQIGSTFSRFKRLVRDLCNDLDKEVELVTFGGDTELDKTVLEKLNDPLVHIIRNSVDHGIEIPSERVSKGKNPKGTVTLNATQSGGNVIIEIKDDGKGLNREAILNKAIKNEIIPTGAELSDQELFNLIFHAGFSTAQTVSNVSGRGVGMDVVKTSIESLRGSVTVESVEGKGTSIFLKLPLTLAIIDGLLVDVGEEFFVLPLTAVEECIELSDEIVARHNGRHIVNIREEIVPYIRLREQFDIKGIKPEIEQVVIANIDNTRIGFVVDEVVGQRQTVIKKLGKAFENVEGVSGATILGDGTVALILDIIKLSQDQEVKENEIFCKV
ncbi:MAG: chemotaxis protein CheA [Melioribacteraceae bacterium]|nr:chemotaxis protein CheA [Melioribacteraceae bacterium]